MNSARNRIYSKCWYLSSTNFRSTETMLETMVLCYYKNFLTALLATIGLAEELSELSDQNECDVNTTDSRKVADCIHRGFTAIPLIDRTVEKLIENHDPVTELSYDEQRKCHVTITNHRKVADCINRSLTAIPSTDREVEELIMSYNPIDEIRNEDIQFYEKLWSFIYVGSDSKANIRALTVHQDAFLNCTALEFITIQNVNLNPLRRILFPVSIKALHFPSTYFLSHNLDVSRLKNLEIANFRDNSLTNFPRFYKYAPLTTINVLENPITAVHVEQIAGYCHLKHLNINVTKEMTENYCTCMRLKKWIHLREIIGLRPTDFQCEPSGRECEISGVTPTMRENYFKCWDNNFRDINFEDNNAISFDQVLLVCICLLVVLLVVMYISLIVIVFKSRQRMKRKIGSKISNSASRPERIEGDLEDEEI